MSAGTLLLAWPGLRARAYLQTMVAARLLPDRVVLLGSEAADATSPQWGVPPRPDFDPSEPLRATLRRAGLTPIQLPVTDVNEPAVVEAVRAAGTPLAVFSGGGILRPPLLEAAGRWLHVHPGRLPDHRGSTCIYYSLLLEGRVTASAFLMARELDQGPVVAQRSFEVPVTCGAAELDHAFDAWIRATVLVEALALLGSGRSDPMPPTPADRGCEFTVIHPVLKHLAVATLRQGRGAPARPKEPPCR